MADAATPEPGPPSTPSRFRAVLVHHGPPTLVPLAVAALLASRGRTTGALVLVVFAFAFLAVRLATHGGADRAVARFAKEVGRVLVAVVLTGVWVVVLVPAALVARALRIRPVPSGLGLHPPSPRSSDPRRPFSPEHDRPRSPALRAASSIALATGLVIVLLAADLAVGMAWERLEPTPESPPDTRALNGAQGTRLGLLDPADPALASTPGIDGVIRAQRTLGLEYWPFLVFHVKPRAVPGLHTDGWVRRTYGGATADAPSVLVFGGSMAFGTGQRDGHTVASALAALARAEGTPIQVRNLGQPGWTMWQSWMRFEQASARTPTDVAVFLNGPEELRAATPLPGVASHVAHAAISNRLEGRVSSDPGVTVVGVAPLPSNEQAILDAYARNSAVGRAWRSTLGTGAAGAADAGGTAGTGDPPGGYGRRPTVAEAAAVYRRGRRIATAIAAERDITPVFAWQPLAPGDSAGRALAGATGTPTRDLTELLAGRSDPFVADGSTNEDGARRVAAALWADIRPAVQRWYREHG